MDDHGHRARHGNLGSQAALALALPLLVCAGAGGAAARPEVDAQSRELEQVARETPLGSPLRLRDLQLGSDRPAVNLSLERFRVFAPEARVVVHGPYRTSESPPPENAYFRGAIEGEPASWALLTVGERGGVRGQVMSQGVRWVVGGGGKARGPAAGLAAREVADGEFVEQALGFSCDAEALGPAPEPPRLAATSAASAGPPRTSAASAGLIASVAIETDFEFFQLFGNSSDAADYVGDLMAHVSTLYASEVNTGLEVSSISLWATSNDPWSQTSATCSLYEFGRYWNENHVGESRSIAHFLSGRSLGGIAWLGGLCRPAFDVNHGGSCPGLVPSADSYGGGYGLSSGLSGSFDLQNPTLVWDSLVVAHEIGHSFKSPHTHCYGGLEGNANPIDGCYVGECGSSGCACGQSSLPAGCPGSGQGCGSLMSYCYLLSGGIGNIGWTLGAGHPYGIEADRVPTRMIGHVQASANQYPGCLVPDNVAPTASDDAYSTFDDLDLQVAAPGVLGNDGDADGDPLSAVLVSSPSNGSLTLDADGSFVYSPDAGFIGSDSFTYKATDGLLESSPAVVTVDVVECTDPDDLVLENETVSGAESFEACRSIVAGPSFQIMPSGNALLEAGSAVSLSNGFSAEQGAGLTVRISG